MNPLPPIDPRRACVYVRVSSAEQASGYGLAAQEAACTSWAAREGWTVVAVCADPGVSGTVPLDLRPGLSAALAAVLRLGAGVLLLAARDRLARDPYIAGDAQRAFAAVGVRMVYVEGGNGTTEGDLLMNDIGHAISAHERRVILARLRAGREAKAARHPNSRAQGGRVPLGYRRTSTDVVIDPTAAAEVRRVFALVRGRRSLRAVAKAMSAETGRPWSSSTVEAIIKRRRYKQGPPARRIVDPRVWNAANAALAARRRSPGAGG